MEPEDILAKISGHKIFSKIDLNQAFLQIPLDDKSQDLTTITTPYGLYKYKFLPFGIKVSPSIFQEQLDKILLTTSNAIAYQDDIIVFSKSAKEHENHLKDVLEKFILFNVQINTAKSVFFSIRNQLLGIHCI